MAAPVFDNAGSASGTNVASIAVTFTLAGSNRVALVDVLEDNTSSVSTVVLGGVSGTFVALKVVGSGFENIETWAVVNPPTGSQTATATFAATNVGLAIIIASNYKDVDQSTPLGTAATNNGNSTAASVVITSATGELAHASIWHRNGQTGYSITGGQTDRATVASGYILAASDIAGAATVTPATSHTNSNGWCAIGVSLKPVSAATTWGALLGLQTNRLVRE